MEYKRKLAEINVPLLDAELRAMLGENYRGLSYFAGDVTVVVDEELVPGEVNRMARVIQDHDPNKRTQEQAMREIEAARLAELRAEPLEFDESEAVDWRRMARWMMRLELEVRWLKSRLGE